MVGNERMLMHVLLKNLDSIGEVEHVRRVSDKVETLLAGIYFIVSRDIGSDQLRKICYNARPKLLKVTDGIDFPQELEKARNIRPRMVKIFDRTIQRQITYDVRSPCKTKNGCGCWPL